MEPHSGEKTLIPLQEAPWLDTCLPLNCLTEPHHALGKPHQAQSTDVLIYKLLIKVPVSWLQDIEGTQLLPYQLWSQ